MPEERVSGDTSSGCFEFRSNVRRISFCFVGIFRLALGSSPVSSVLPMIQQARVISWS